MKWTLACRGFISEEHAGVYPRNLRTYSQRRRGFENLRADGSRVKMKNG